MKIFKLKYSQKLPISLNEAWDFLSSPNNLELITPKSMDFNITDWDKKKAYPGQIIQYTVKPLFGVKINWVTEITQVKDKEFFIDEQRFGPYSFWHHKHFIEEIPNGVKMTDSSVKCPVRLQIAIEHSINGIIVLKICQAATPSSLSM